MSSIPAVVIGGGPAGLATSRELSARGVEHRLLERGELAHCWANVYDSLTLHTGRHLSALPGMPIPRSAPLFVPRDVFLRYLHDYRERFALPLEGGTEVTSVARANGGWRIETSRGSIEAGAVVVASGIMSAPRIPTFPGQERFRGPVRHTVTYRRPDELRGKRVLVVGAGNSAGEIASELARAGIDVTVAIRSGANVVPLQILGIPIQYLSYLIRKLPRAAQEAVVAGMRKFVDLRRGPPVIPRPSTSPLDSIPLIGFNLVDAIREQRVRLRGGIGSFTEDGVRFLDGSEESFDEVLLATGFRAALPFLGDLVKTDARGFGMRTERVVSSDQPALFFVGHNYDATGGLFNIRRDAPLAAARVKAAGWRT